MKFKNVKFYILAIISLLIMFFIFPINAFAEDTGYVEYSYTAFHEYTGQDIYLDDLVLTFNGTTLVKDVDYTISYNDSDYVNAGTKNATITIDENNEYVASNNTKNDTIQYSIIQKSFESADIRIDCSPSFYYNGSDEPTPEFNVYDDAISKDYTLSSDNYEYSATYDYENKTGELTITGKGNYKDSKTVSFTLATRRWGDENLTSVVDSDTTFKGEPAMYFNNDMPTPGVNLKYGDDLLTEGVDYEASLIPASSISSTNELHIKFKGNYYGDYHCNFYYLYQLTKEDPLLEIDEEFFKNPGYSLGLGQTYFPNPEIVYNGETISSDDYTITTVVKDNDGNVHTNGSETGISSEDADGSVYTAYVTIEFANQFSGELQYEIKIGPRIDGAKIVLLDNGNLDESRRTISYYYTGEKIIPSFDLEFEVNSETRTLKINEDFKISNPDDLPTNVDSDGYGVDMYIEGIGNYAGGLSYTILVEPIDAQDLIYDIPEYIIYNNEAVTLDLEIKDKNNNTLVNGTDYSISYENNEAIGNASYYIEFSGNYEGTKEGTFRIISKEITIDDPLLEVIGINDSDYYIGSNTTISPSPIVEYNGETLSSDEYEIIRSITDDDGNEYETRLRQDDANGNVYHGHITIKFTGTYGGSVSYDYEIKPSIETAALSPLDDARVDGNNLYYEYKGKAIEPSFDLLLSISDDETKTLKYGTDFTLSSSEFKFDKIDVTNGSVEFLLKGIGNYAGTAYVYYEIEPKDIENVSINSSKNCYRDGTDLLYDLELYFEDIEFNLVKDTDYTIEYSIVADENKANFKLTGINNFTGENNELSLPLATKKLDDLNITIKYDKEDENVMYFTGSENVPNIIIEDNDSNVLVKDTDYIVEYIGDFTTYGETIAFNITGINDVYGIYSDEFSLESNTIAEIEFEYRGKAKLSVYLENSQYKDYLKEYEDIDIEEAKKYELLVTLNDGYIFNNEEEYSASGILSIIINKYVIDEALEISSEDVYYNGKDIEIDLNVLDKYDNVLIKDKDYSVTFENNDKAGTAKAILEGINNYSGTFNYEFEIKGKDISKNISFDTDNNIYFNVDTDSYLFNVTLTDDELDYSLIKEKDYTLNYEIIDNLNAKIIIEGINNYSGTLTKDVKIASKLLSEMTIDVKYDSKEDNINVMNYTGVETLPIIKITDGEDELIKERDYIINIIGDFKEYASTINFDIVGINNYYGKYSDEYIIKTTVIDEIINESAKEIVSTATESSEFNLNELDFEKLTGLSKEELLKAKEFYNNLEKYVVDKGLDILVNDNLRELGYDTVLEASDIALRLKEFLDEYAVNSGYTNFDSQIDDAINALEIEETKDVAKEELNAFIHRHTKASTMDKLHSVVGEQEEILNSLYYEKWTDDESRAAYFEELNNKVHEIKNVSLVIVKHTQSQAIANNNIEAYYEELKNSGKYNEAQLQLLKEVFDEMQEKVEALLYASKEEDQLAIQEQLNKIVEEAIEKLSGVEISSISTNPDEDNYCVVESTLGMNGKTTLEIENASKNVSFTISRAINSGNVKGEENGILLIKNKDVKEAFDIDLLVDDNKVEEFKGVYTVKILLTDELKQFSNLQIIYIAEDGSLEVHETHVDGDYLVFTTSHFSIYYLLGDKVFDFAPIIKILLSVIAALIIFNVYLVLKIKKKKINELLLVLSFGFVPLSAMISINVLIVSIILGIIAFIFLVVAILLAIKDYKIDRRLADEE